MLVAVTTLEALQKHALRLRAADDPEVASPLSREQSEVDLSCISSEKILQVSNESSDNNRNLSKSKGSSQNNPQPNPTTLTQEDEEAMDLIDILLMEYVR